MCTQDDHQIYYALYAILDDPYLMDAWTYISVFTFIHWRDLTENTTQTTCIFMHACRQKIHSVAYWKLYMCITCLFWSVIVGLVNR